MVRKPNARTSRIILTESDPILLLANSKERAVAVQKIAVQSAYISPCSIM